MTRFQIAYRPLQSALDHLSTLHALIVDAEQNNKSLYVCFLDYKKFYDKCSRPHMWTTFVEMGFKGKTTVALHSIFQKHGTQLGCHQPYTLKLLSKLMEYGKAHLLAPFLHLWYLKNLLEK